MKFIPEENDKHLKLVIDQTLLDKYTKYYFIQHPRARKVPIEKPWHPSINQWCILPRIQMNALKQKWKNFMVYACKVWHVDGMKLDDLDVISTVYLNSRRSADCDNYSIKFCQDGWTEAEFIVDDNYKHLHSLTLKIDYDKEYPRQEFDVYYR